MMVDLRPSRPTSTCLATFSAMSRLRTAHERVARNSLIAIRAVPSPRSLDAAAFLPISSLLWSSHPYGAMCLFDIVYGQSVEH